MVDYSAPLYQHQPEVWDAKKCSRLANRVDTDGLGTPYPFKGHVSIGHYAHGMVVRYNGGTVIDGEWWQGEQWSLPVVADGFEIIQVPGWGHRIKRVNDPLPTK